MADEETSTQGPQPQETTADGAPAQVTACSRCGVPHAPGYLVPSWCGVAQDQTVGLSGHKDGCLFLASPRAVLHRVPIECFTWKDVDLLRDQLARAETLTVQLKARIYDLEHA